jgi:hypothetical protein
MQIFRVAACLSWLRTIFKTTTAGRTVASTGGSFGLEEVLDNHIFQEHNSYQDVDRMQRSICHGERVLLVQS